MREAIGGTWLLGLVLTFIVFFASFLAISINYAKAFNVKNNIVDIIEKYEGNNSGTREKITEYLYDVGYLVPGKCLDNYTGYDLNGNKICDGSKAYYCITNDSIENTMISDKYVTNANGDIEYDVLKKQYYRVMIFFKMDLPAVGDIFTMRIKGETESIYFAADDNNLCR